MGVSDKSTGAQHQRCRTRPQKNNDNDTVLFLFYKHLLCGADSTQQLGTPKQNNKHNRTVPAFSQDLWFLGLRLELRAIRKQTNKTTQV